MLMTLKEVVSQYPNQWIGVRNIVYDFDSTIKQLDVIYTDKSAYEIRKLAHAGIDVKPFYTKTFEDKFIR